MKAELNGIGPWRLLEVVGSGERATVYKALREGAPPGSPFVAVKVLHAPLAADPIMAEAFLARGRAGLKLARMEHPAIVPVLEVVPGPRPYIISELEDALALERLMPERGRAKVPLEAGTNLVIAVLDALAAAANDRMVHGRLTPSDVLVRADGLVRVTSFGQDIGRDGDARADFLAVHRLCQSLGSPWLPEVDAWLDRLAAEETPWKDLRAARGAFPLAFTDYGQAGLERLVKNRRKKDQKAAELAAAEAAGLPAPTRGGAAAGSSGSSAAGASKARRPKKPTPGEAEHAIRQARIVALSCAGAAPGRARHGAGWPAG
ncbi:MAG: protein kinase [Myxococcota bacterium]